MRVRLDVIVDRACKRPSVLIEPPLIVIEILSPSDSCTSTQKLATDYENMGVPNIWLIDPETKPGRICEGPIWKEVKRLEVGGRDIYLALDWLFDRLEPYDAR